MGTPLVSAVTLFLAHFLHRTPHSRCAANEEAKKTQGKKSWELKRSPQAPKEAEVVNFSENKPVQVHALKFEFLA